MPAAAVAAVAGFAAVSAGAVAVTTLTYASIAATVVGLVTKSKELTQIGAGLGLASVGAGIAGALEAGGAEAASGLAGAAEAGGETAAGFTDAAAGMGEEAAAIGSEAGSFSLPEYVDASQIGNSVQMGGEMAAQGAQGLPGAPLPDPMGSEAAALGNEAGSYSLPEYVDASQIGTTESSGIVGNAANAGTAPQAPTITGSTDYPGYGTETPGLNPSSSGASITGQPAAVRDAAQSANNSKGGALSSLMKSPMDWAKENQLIAYGLMQMGGQALSGAMGANVQREQVKLARDKYEWNKDNMATAAVPTGSMMPTAASYARAQSTFAPVPLSNWRK